MATAASSTSVIWPPSGPRPYGATPAQFGYSAFVGKMNPEENDAALQRYQAAKDAWDKQEADRYASDMRAYNDYLARTAAEKRARAAQIEDRNYAAGQAKDARDFALGMISGGTGGGTGGGFSTSASGSALGSVATGGGSTTAPGQVAVPDTTAADSAARTQAKERAATRLQGSMRALDTAMASRGIRGSGIQADEMTRLVSDSANEETQAELDRLNRLSDMQFAASGQNATLQNQWGLGQLQAQQWAQERADRLANEQRQLALTLAQFGLRY